MSSDFYPLQSRCSSMDTFQDLVESDWMKLRLNWVRRSSVNVSTEERLAITSLKENSAIRQADKGGCVVVMNTTDYISEVKRQLNDPDTYLNLPSNPQSEYIVTLTNWSPLVSHWGWWILGIKITWWDHSLLSRSSTTSPRYTNHWSPLKADPLLQARGQLTKAFKIGWMLALKPLVPQLDSYFRDWGHLLKRLSLKWLDTYTWISMVVKSLYSMIPHGLGLLAITDILQSTWQYTEDFMHYTLLVVEFLLTHNFFYFYGDFYL